MNHLSPKAQRFIEIEALSETLLWQISLSDLEDVYATSKSGNLIGEKWQKNYTWPNPKEPFHF